MRDVEQSPTTGDTGRSRVGVSLAMVVLTMLAALAAGVAVAGATTPAAPAGAAPAADLAQDDPGDEELQAGRTYFAGQVLFTDRYDAGARLTLRTEGGSFVTDLVVDDDGVLRIDTERLEAGGYVVNGPDDSQVAFELAVQQLAATADRNQVTSTNAEVTVTVTSNRNGYPLVVSSDSLNAETIASRSDKLSVVDGQAVLTDASTEETLTVDFGGLVDGEYTLDLAARDADAAASVSVTVGTGGSDGTAVVGGSGFVTEEIGDVAAIPIDFSETSGATVTIGSEALGWQARLTVRDVNGDGTATVLVNTDNVRQTGPVFSAAGQDRVSGVENLAGGQFADSDRRIAPADYPIQVAVGDRQTDLGTLVLESPNTVQRRVTVTRAPGQLRPGEVPAAPGVSGSGSAAATVAAGDWVVFQVQAAGVFGYVDGVEDLGGEGTQGVSLTVVQRSPGAGRGQDVFGDGAGYSLVPRPEANVLLVFARTELGGLDAGETYRATLTVDASNPYVESTVRRSADVDVEQPDARVTAPGGQVGVANVSDGRITGTSNLASGTELAVSVRSPGDVAGGQAVRTTVPATVRNGTWTATVDLSRAAVGQELTVEVARTNGDRLGRIDGVVTPPAAVRFEDQTAGGGQVLSIDRVSVPNGGFVAVYDAPPSEGGTLLGTSTLLSPGERTDVTVTLDEPLTESRSVVAVVHTDDGNGVFDFLTSGGDVDQPYTVDGATVTAEATVSLDGGTDTATPTETATATPTDTGTTTDDTDTATPTETQAPTATETTDDGDGDGDGGDLPLPGFGVVAPLVALAAALLLLRRRR